MYSSAIAPSRHFATVTMRLPSANSGEIMRLLASAVTAYNQHKARRL
jgi:hypothetical protein